MKNNPSLLERIANHRSNQSTSKASPPVSGHCHGARLLAIVAALVLLATGFAQASDPIGIYALVDKVVIEPNEASPERIQIWGAFALAEGNGNIYKSAERGYLYYKLNPDKVLLCQNEWADLKSVAGTGQIVSFGARYQEKGAMRKPGAKPENPDKYPVAMGVHKVQAEKNYGPIKSLIELRDAQKAKDKTPASKN